ncbi:hypothetical protein FOS14_22390 [Skermania sp. ID1734]|uniref:hypothetical protein n=1 Tax=Skermania sp. ID1734 TaxID=2597516 RepID=UPI00117E0C98|nr:hypothetical protein [Skermania sp. ID1734]TSD93806.1 hypothetical protein FOS14_22390 [Skermania sp. ID1734]
MDLSGFTALTQIHGDEPPYVADHLTVLARSVISSHDRLIKTIRDAVLSTSATSASGIEMTGRIRGVTAADSFPVVRIGTHFGPVVFRGGDPVCRMRIRTAAASGRLRQRDPLNLTTDSIVNY